MTYLKQGDMSEDSSELYSVALRGDYWYFSFA